MWDITYLTSNFQLICWVFPVVFTVASTGQILNNADFFPFFSNAFSKKAQSGACTVLAEIISSLLLAPTSLTLISIATKEFPLYCHFLKPWQAVFALLSWTQLFTMHFHHSLIPNKKKKPDDWLQRKRSCAVWFIPLLRRNGTDLQGGWSHALCYYVTPYVFLVDAYRLDQHTHTFQWVS